MTTTYDPAYWEALRANRGSAPTRVDAERWWDMLEVMWPRNWRSPESDKFECFAVNEMQTDDLYTWLVRIGQHETLSVEYWEFIAPDDSTDADLMARIDAARKVPA
jgi:hypothetical protein